MPFKKILRRFQNLQTDRRIEFSNVNCVKPCSYHVKTLRVKPRNTVRFKNSFLTMSEVAKYELAFHYRNIAKGCTTLKLLIEYYSTCNKTHEFSSFEE